MTILDTSKFLSKQEIGDIIQHQKQSYTTKKLKQLYSHDEYKKLMTDFWKKFANEYLPTYQVSPAWLKEQFGFEGELRVNTDTQGIDAIYTDRYSRRFKTIELKHISVMEAGLTLTGVERTSLYHNGIVYWDIGGKSWKFRDTAEQFVSDYTLLLITNSENDELIEAILLTNAQTKRLLADNMPRNFDGGAHPIALCYRHVKEFPHMVGNKAPIDYTGQIIEAALAADLIYRKSAKGSFYVHDQRLSIGDSQVKAIQWLREARIRGGVYDSIFAIEDKKGA